jgi:hypothetical protein
MAYYGTLKNIRFIFLCIVVIAAAVVYFVILDKKVITPQQLGTYYLPAGLKRDFKAGLLPRHWLYVRIKDQQINYVSSNPANNSFWRRREQAILNSLHELHAKKDLPQGGFLFCIDDGVNKSYTTSVLAFAARKELVQNKAVILIPDFEAMLGYQKLFSALDAAKKQYSWSQKVSKIFWRGTPNGGNRASFKIDGIARLEFMQIAQKADYIDAGITSYKADLDATFVAKLQQQFPIVPYISPQESLKYKYLIDIDGHSCSYSRTAWILYSNSLLFKHQSENVQWYYSSMQPYQHYIPVVEDFSNLQLQFAWAEQHPSEVQKIINDAQQLAAQTFSQESVLQSLKLALQQYAELNQF